MREKVLYLILREIENVKAGSEGKIIMKMNSLVDPMMISALYEASNNGVKIELIMRGICCLVPGIKDLSENITVRSIVGRFLEHSRVLYFYNNGNEEFYLSSADLMQRNLDRRVEIIFPIESVSLKEEIRNNVLKIYSKDNIKARELYSDMTYKFVKAKDGSKKINSQEWLMNNAMKSSGNFSKTIR